MTGGTIAYQPELAPAIAVPRPDPRVRRTHLALHQAMVALCLVRSRLHAIAGRHEDRLVFDLQTAVAESFGDRKSVV